MKSDCVLVIGDCHLDTLYPGYLEAQIKFLMRISSGERFSRYGLKFDRLIFLGDVFNKRKPSPEVLLKFMELLKYILGKHRGIKIDIVRGNHDSSTKADDGITALSLFEMLPNVKVWTHSGVDEEDGFAFVPHYEDTNTIRKFLQSVPLDYRVFGHFGCVGYHNSAGDYDGGIEIDDIHHETVLGHIHHHAKQGKVTILGTPYTTQFSESGKASYVLILDEGVENIYELYDPSPVYETINYNEKISESKAEDYRLLRINFDRYLAPVEDPNFRDDIKKKHNLQVVDIKFIPSFDEDTKLSDYQPMGGTIDAVSDEIISSYINESNTNIPKEELTKGLSLIKNEINKN